MLRAGPSSLRTWADLAQVRKISRMSITSQRHQVLAIAASLQASSVFQPIARFVARPRNPVTKHLRPRLYAGKEASEHA